MRASWRFGSCGWQGYVLLSVALVWTVCFVARQMGMAIARSGWVFVLLLAQIGTFLAFAYPPRSIGYNELASWLTQLGVALILLSLAAGVPVTVPGDRSMRPGQPEVVDPVPQTVLLDRLLDHAAPPDEVVPDEGVPEARRASRLRGVLWPIWAGLGAIVVLLLFAKATSGLAFGAVLAVALLVPNWRFRLWKQVVRAHRLCRAGSRS